MPQYKGLKLAHDTNVCARYRDIHKVEIDDPDKLLFDEPGRVGNGRNSGFQALNIALQFGSPRGILLGFDMHGGTGLHWYGRNAWKGARNPASSNFMRWRDAFEGVVPELRRRGIEIVNASPDSALVCFPRKTVDEAIEHWKL